MDAVVTLAEPTTYLERLQRDHQVLRGKFGALDTALHFGSEARFILRAFCFTLSRQLRDHSQREMRCIAACYRARGRCNFDTLTRFAIDHHEEQVALRFVNRCIARSEGAWWDDVRAALQRAQQWLRRHIEEQEAQLFPLLKQHGLEDSLILSPSVGCRTGVRDTMTAQQLQSEYPQAPAVCAQLGIDLTLEAPYSLEEIAWRHGMRSRHLLVHLEQRLTAPPPRSALSLETMLEPVTVETA